jgi:hypothetical protein
MKYDDDKQFQQFKTSLSPEIINDLLYVFYCQLRNYQFKKDDLKIKYEQEIQEIKNILQEKDSFITKLLQQQTLNQDAIINAVQSTLDKHTSLNAVSNYCVNKNMTSSTIGEDGERYLQDLIRTHFPEYDVLEETTKKKNYADCIITRHGVRCLLEVKNVAQNTLNARLGNYVKDLTENLEIARGDDIHVGLLVFMRDHVELNPKMEKILIQNTNKGRVAIIFVDQARINKEWLYIAIDTAVALTKILQDDDSSSEIAFQKLKVLFPLIESHSTTCKRLKKTYTEMGTQLLHLSNEIDALVKSISTNPSPTIQKRSTDIIEQEPLVIRLCYLMISKLNDDKFTLPQFIDFAKEHYNTDITRNTVRKYGGLNAVKDAALLYYNSKELNT